MSKKALTELFVERLRPPDTGRIEIWDTYLPGFGLRVTERGLKTFVAFTRRRGSASKVRITLGRYPPLKVGDARELARRCMERASIGEDPRSALMPVVAEVAKPATRETFKEAVEDYIKRFQRGEQANAQADEVKRVLLRECAEWAEQFVDSIAPRDVRRLLEGIRDGFPHDDGEPTLKPRGYLSNRCYSYLKTFFRWCAEPGVEKVEISPLEGLRRPWGGESRRTRVYTDNELRALWAAGGDLKNVGLYGGVLLRVMLLLGKRKGALAAMRHDQIAEDGFWTPPQDSRRRRGNKRNHPVPLPQAAHDIIAKLPKVEGNPFVFAGRKKGHHLDPGSPLQEAIKRSSKVGDFFFHAVRHTVETRLAELKVPPHIRDMLLDHAPARGAGAGYDHHHYKSEMSHALELWSSALLRIVRPEAEFTERGREAAGG